LGLPVCHIRISLPNMGSSTDDEIDTLQLRCLWGDSCVSPWRITESVGISDGNIEPYPEQALSRADAEDFLITLKLDNQQESSRLPNLC